MKAKVSCTKVDVSLEKRILIGFIVSTDFIKNISRIYNKSYFSASPSRLLAKWCVAYFNKHDKAPNKHIADIYIVNKRKGAFDEDTSEYIEDLLEELSSEWENIESTFNSKQLIEQAVDFFNEKHLFLTKEKV